MTTTIADLSPELMVKIFSHYIESEGHIEFTSNVVLVCKRWRELSSTASLWKSIDVQHWDFAVSVSKRGLLHNTRSLKIPSRYTTNPKARKFHDRVFLESDRLLAVLPNIRELNTLEIYNNAIDADTMTTLARLCPGLERLHMTRVGLGRFGRMNLEELDPMLNKCGAKLKHLNITFCELMHSEELLTQIAEKCQSLEVFELHCLYFWLQCVDIVFPIYKFVDGCVRLRRLELSDCELITADGNDASGFRDLTAFKATRCNFYGWDVCGLLKHSTNLECLELDLIDNLIFNDASRISSNKMKFLYMQLKDKDVKLEDLETAVNKWKHSLLHLKILGWGCDVTSVLKIILDDNECPKLEALWIEQNCVDLDFLEKEFVGKCRNLRKLTIYVYEQYVEMKEFVNREQVLNFRGLFVDCVSTFETDMKFV